MSGATIIPFPTVPKAKKSKAKRTENFTDVFVRFSSLPPDLQDEVLAKMEARLASTNAARRAASLEGVIP